MLARRRWTLALCVVRFVAMLALAIDLILLGGTALVLTGAGFALHRLSAPRV